MIELRSGGVSARVTTRGGAILRLDCGAVPLLRPAGDGAEPGGSACFPLVPFGNRVRGNRFSFRGRDYHLRPNRPTDPHYLHGEGWLSDWGIRDRDATSVALDHSHDGSALPYVYDAVQRLSLRPDGADLELSVTNRGAHAMPFGLGWHPYFPMTPATTLQTEASRLWTEDPGWLPGHPVEVPAEMDFSTPRRLPAHWVNNGYDGWSGKARITWPERGLALQITADPVFRVMFLFVSDTSFDAGYQRDHFALEPMSHMADGHNQPDLGGLAVLEPGESLSGRMGLTVEALPAP